MYTVFLNKKITTIYVNMHFGNEQSANLDKLVPKIIHTRSYAKNNEKSKQWAHNHM